ncbi:MAG: CPBP family intramembrane glutamic endopeptidase [Nannocystaceae bacterium]
MAQCPSIGDNHGLGHDARVQNKPPPPAWAIGLQAVTSILAPLSEEVPYRALLVPTMRRHMSKSSAVIAGLLVILALTNPSEADHRQAVANSVGASLNPFGQAVVSAAEGLIPLRCNNYILGSSCSINGRTVRSPR